MPRPDCCLEVARRLERHAMPTVRIQRITEELTEHWEDLVREAREKGLDDSSARGEATRRLGDPALLAATAIEGLRRRSWMGRHPIITICLLPLFLPLFLMALALGPFAWMDSTQHLTSGVTPETTSALVFLSVFARCVHYGAAGLTLGWLSWSAWRCGLGRQWIIALSVLCALCALSRHFDADPIKRHMSLGFRFPLPLNRTTLLLLLVHALPLLFIIWPTSLKNTASLNTQSQ